MVSLCSPIFGSKIVNKLSDASVTSCIPATCQKKNRCLKLQIHSLCKTTIQDNQHELPDAKLPRIFSLFNYWLVKCWPCSLISQRARLIPDIAYMSVSRGVISGESRLWNLSEVLQTTVCMSSRPISHATGFLYQKETNMDLSILTFQCKTDLANTAHGPITRIPLLKRKPNRLYPVKNIKSSWSSLRRLTVVFPESRLPSSSRAKPRVGTYLRKTKMPTSEDRTLQ